MSEPESMAWTVKGKLEVGDATASKGKTAARKAVVKYIFGGRWEN